MRDCYQHKLKTMTQEVSKMIGNLMIIKVNKRKVYNNIILDRIKGFNGLAIEDIFLNPTNSA